MKQAVFICDIPQFSPNVVQKLFKIDPENFENLGVKFENVEFLLVSAANRGKRIQEVDELTTFFLQHLFGLNLDPESPDNNVDEVKIFAAKIKPDGNFVAEALHMFVLTGSLSIEDCLKAFGYEIVGDISLFE